MKRPFTFFKTCLFLAIFFSLNSYAQPLDPNKKLTQYNIDQWESDELPSSGILQMIQTSDGYLWLATFNALVRFDGVKFTSFTKFSEPEFEATGFRSLYEDPSGNMWIGSNGGGLYLKENGSFRRFVVPFGPSSNNIKRIFCDSKGVLWLGTTKGLVMFQDSTFHQITPKSRSEITDMPVYDIEEDETGKIWIASGNGVYTYKNNELSRFTTSSGQPVLGECFDLLVDNANSVWFAFYNSGFFKYADNQIERIRELDVIERPTVIFRDKDNSMWFGSEEGIARFSNGSYSFLNENLGLAHDNISTIIEDHEGSVWVGTYYGGLNRLRDGAFTNHTVLNGLTHNTVHVVYENKDGQIYVGTENGLNCFIDNRFMVCPELPELAKERVRDMFEDSQGNLWVATYSGLFKYGQDKKLVRLTIKDGICNNQTRVLMENVDGSILVGTRNGLSVYKNNSWNNYTAENSGLRNDFILSLTQIDSSSIFIGTTGGLHVMRGDSIHPYIASDRGFLNSTIFRMYQDEQGDFWVGSNEGLMYIKNREIFNYSKTHPLFSANIYQILSDEDGMLWMSSDKGIIRVSMKKLIEKTQNYEVELNPTLFDRSNGLRSNEVTAVSNSLKKANGTLWFATLEGVSSIDPDHILINEIPPPIVIDKIMISGEEYYPGMPITIAPNVKNIEIHYTGLSYMIPKKVRFKYMLEGYDDDWNDVGDRRTAYYTSLPPGEYTFKLAACNNDGIWNTKESAVVFIVDRAFWQTPSFFIMAFLITGIFIVGIIEYRTRSVKRDNRILEDKIRERTQEVINQKEEIETQRDQIEEKNKALEHAQEELKTINENLELNVRKRTEELQSAYTDLIRVNKELDDFVYKSSHDIKGPLARLQGLVNLAILEMKDQPANEYLEILREETIQANNIIQKLSHAYEVKHSVVSKTDINLKSLVQNVINHVQLRNERSKVEFELEIKDDMKLRSDQKLLSEVLFNIIENAQTFSSPKTPKVRVSSKQVNGEVLIEVADNGIGIDEQVREEIFKMFVKGTGKSNGLGLGLYISQKAAETIRGSINLKKTDDLGTVFEIKLPVNLP